MYIKFKKTDDNRYRVYLVKIYYNDEGKRRTKSTLLKIVEDFNEIKLLAKKYRVEIYEEK
ncbi:hypothetical protein MUB24_06070 [Lederbergia sp. NSJ-179]|uniref:hypothetical protein n=1 Tax=Lederbergia sp. NSJ-179 TaxID=2931402 RepID=UPI001FD20C89|nr:hypothetical protein [Lederbergia sp. NSJ-179]MCJ7840492.1 hypothetical protein [Lederbergia sp. NSJ-179]